MLFAYTCPSVSARRRRRPGRVPLVIYQLDVVQRHLRGRARETLEPVYRAAFVGDGVEVEYSEPARAEDAAEGEGSGGPGCSVRLPNRDAASCPRFTSSVSQLHAPRLSCWRPCGSCVD
jgi:hypothetical protein